jgi:hypothetical protein
MSNSLILETGFDSNNTIYHAKSTQFPLAEGDFKFSAFIPKSLSDRDGQARSRNWDRTGRQESQNLIIQTILPALLNVKPIYLGSILSKILF